ncbi:MAG: hypothetical protein NVV70_03745 [Cellulomonas sp.]|nr:hypothetical protein [Cellulomonas sp.]MCR6647281.1 hypothetical protein [Cellulomonas sp.]
MNENDPLTATARAAHELREAERHLREAEHRRRAAINAARDAGATWASIGAAAGITRHRAHQIIHPNGIHA